MSQKEKNRKIRAILAGGLVLGVGAAVTLAAWNDSEFAKGNFRSGQFNMQGSTDGTTFSDHPELDKAQLGFSVGFDNLSPNDTVAAPFVLHLDKDTTNNAQVSVATATVTGTAATQLTYEIIQVGSTGACTPAASGTQIVPAGTAMDSVAGATAFTLEKSIVPGTDPGADVFLCVQVTAKSTIAQNTIATGTWEFLGASTS